MINKTNFGYKVRVTGLGMRAGQVAGINSSKIFLSTAFLAGAIAGLGGAGIALGTYRRFIDGFSGGLGFSGISIAALAAYSPLAVFLSGLLFGVLKAGTLTMSRAANYPQEIASIIQALVVVFISAPGIVTSVGDGKMFQVLKKLGRPRLDTVKNTGGGPG